MALTPIARFDVVPRQRIITGQTFNFGVIAFSKAGIQDVEFTITPSVGSYNGTNPVTVTSMSLNPRTGVWEYWTPIAANDFTADTSFTIGAVVTGDDTGERDLGTITMFKDSAAFDYTAWVDGVNGDDGTGELDNQSKPYKTIDAAIDDIETANSNEIGGCCLYLEESSYTASYQSHNATSQWFVIQKASGATKENVILTAMSGYDEDGYFKFKGLKLNRTGDYVLYGNKIGNLWLDDCNCYGTGWHTADSDTVLQGTIDYATDCYFTDSEWGLDSAIIARGTTMYQIGNDAYVNCLLVVNCDIDELDPGETGWHSDAVQNHSGPFDNRIVYNFKATNCAYQGIFMETTGGGNGTNLAFVNCLVHMSVGYNIGGMYIGDEGENSWNHILVWNGTFPNGWCGFWDGVDYNNVSLVGNVFLQFCSGTNPAPQFIPENTDGNEALHNHFIQLNAPDPYNGAYADSDSGGSKSTGDAGINTGVDPTNDEYGRPQSGSTLIGRFTSKVPVDMQNTERGATSDVGALEYKADVSTDFSTSIILKLG